MSLYDGFYVHGFLGLPSDWDLLLSNHGTSHARISLWDYASDPEVRDLASAAARLNGEARARLERTGSQGLLCGYSLGARIALHALLEAPQLWRAAIFISASAGLESNDDRRLRVEKDEQWALRFESEPWTELLEAWNRQDVFRGDGPSPFRRPEQFKRETLAFALRKWSLGRQENLTPRLAEIKLPTLWVAGSRDTKFAALTERYGESNPIFKSTIIPGTGHRVPLSQPSRLRTEIHEFLTHSSKEQMNS
jgi:2-succinyl-6-hydroxy-2,4-cyclohexadiene-1-carboxylate synthase